MNAIKQTVLVVLVSLLAACSSDSVEPAKGSSGTRGGGDPDSVEFLHLANHLSEWMLKYRTSEQDQPVTKAFVAKVDELGEQMDDEQNPSIRFTDEEVTDSSNTTKVATFSKDPQHILVQRGRWAALDKRDKYTVVALEVYGLIGIDKRYSEVGDMIMLNYAHIVDIGGEINSFQSIEAALSFTFFNSLDEQIFNMGYPEDADIDWLGRQETFLFKFERAMAYYQRLPLPVQVDSFIGGFYSFQNIKDDKLSYSTTHVWGASPIPEQYSQYMLAVLELLQLRLMRIEGTDQQAQDQLNRILAEVRDFKRNKVEILIPVEGQENTVQSFIKSPYSEYMDAFQTTYLQRISANDCKLPVSFEDGYTPNLDQMMAEALSQPTLQNADLDQKYEQAELELYVWQTRLEDITGTIADLDREDKLTTAVTDQIISPIEQVNMIVEVLEKMTHGLYVVNERFVNFTMRPIEDAWKKDVLCIKN